MASKIRAIMECSVCLETFKKPKCLPCAHTFCLKCLKGQGELPGDELFCALCRRVFKIPPGGLEQLPNNYIVEEMNEVLSHKELGSAGDRKAECETCDKDEVTKFCVECSQDLCESCALIHGRARGTKTHKIVIQEDKESSPLMTSYCPSYCEKHSDKQLELYCNDCETAICLKCSALEHGSHVKSDILNASKKLIFDIKQSNASFDKFLQFIRSELNQLESDKEKFLNQLPEIEHAIKLKGEMAKQLVDSQVAQLLDQLKSIKTDRLKEIQTRKDEVERQMLILDSYQRYVGVLTDKGTPYDVTRNFKDLLERAEEIVTSQEQFENDKLSSLVVTFQEANVDSKTGDYSQIIGRISTEGMGEKTLVILGLDNGSVMTQQVCHVSLSRVDACNAVGSTPTQIPTKAAACVFAGSLYAVGLGDLWNEMWKYSSQSEWIRLADLESGRSRHCVAVVGSMLYVLGGWAKRTTFSSVLSYNISSNTWSTVGQLTHAVERAACVAYKDSIYVFGGATVGDVTVNHVQMYNTVSQKCSLVPNAMPQAYHLMRAVLWKTSAVLLLDATCLVYNFETQTWLEREQYKTDVDHFGLVLSNNTLYIAGGETLKKDRDDNWIGTYSDEIKSVSVMDILSDKPAVWKHQAKLPQAALVQAYSPTPMRLRPN